MLLAANARMSPTSNAPGDSPPGGARIRAVARMSIQRRASLSVLALARSIGWIQALRPKVIPPSGGLRLVGNIVPRARGARIRPLKTLRSLTFDDRRVESISHACPARDRRPDSDRGRPDSPGDRPGRQPGSRDRSVQDQGGRLVGPVGIAEEGRPQGDE